MVATTLASPAALRAAVRSLVTMSSGVPAGTNSADHCWPLCLRLGTSGSATSGLSPQCASARSLPALTCCATVLGPLATASTVPPSSASTAGLAPVYGMWVSCTPLLAFNISIGTCIVP